MNLRSRIERLPPYPSLFLLGIPWLVVECTKLVALVVAGTGHWLSGAAFLICGYGAGIPGTERLFAIVKPKLLTLPWFVGLEIYRPSLYASTRSFQELWLNSALIRACDEMSDSRRSGTDVR